MKYRKPAIAMILAVVAYVAFTLYASPAAADDNARVLRDDFYLYQLELYCDPNFASKIFSARGDGIMGTKVLCAGRCEGRMVSVESVLAGLPKKVANAFRDQIRAHEEKAAAGSELSMAQCGVGQLPEKCDRGKACESIGGALRLVKDARVPAGSAELYASLQKDLGPLLDRMGQQLCDKAGQKSIDTIKSDLQALNFVNTSSNLQNNLRLARMEEALRQMTYSQCGVKPPPDRQSVRCSDGEKAKDPGDDEAAKFMEDKLKEAMDQIRDEIKAATEGKTAVGDVKQHIDELNGKLAKLASYVSLYQRIRSLSCLPPDVLQAMRQVANDRRAENHSNNCVSFCRAMTRWFESLMDTSSSFQGKLFMEDCLGRCN